MTALSALWLPILLSAVFVFIASSIIHMAPLWHKSDYPMLEKQDAVMDSLRAMALPHGEYMLPRPKDMKDMRTPEFKEKFKRGPVLMMTIIPNASMSMGKPMGQWFVYCLITSLLTAFATAALAPGAVSFQIYRIAGIASFLAYASALWQTVIWYHRSVSVTAKSTIDSAIYAIITAATFAWLWPK